MEGVMMKNKDEYAVAVRKPNNEIAVEKSTHKDFSDKVKLFKLPVFRGMLAFVDSMVIGMKVLNFSASFFEDEEDTQTKKNKDKKNKDKKKTKSAIIMDDDFEMEEISVTKAELDQEESGPTVSEAKKNPKDEKSTAIMMIFAVLISIVLSVTLFMVLPVLITGFFSRFIDNKILMSFIEGIMRLTIFIGYVLLTSKMPEIKRVFMYHGAEHKTINCLENGFELTVENVRWQSKQHKRCGTSFMLLVILISLIFFMIVPVSGMLMKVLSRILLVPFIAGVSYEFIRLAGKSESKLVHVLSQPGLWMQGLTTKEPDDAMIEVAIKSVESVFDWRAFINPAASTEEPKKTASVDEKVAPVGKEAVVKKENKQNKQKKTTTDYKVAEKDKVVEKDNADSILDSVGKTTAATLQTEAVERKTSAATEKSKSTKLIDSEEEDDEILKALDKFFDYSPKESGNTGEA